MIYFSNSSVPLPPYVVSEQYYDNSRDLTNGWVTPHWWIPESPFTKNQIGD